MKSNQFAKVSSLMVTAWMVFADDAVAQCGPGHWSQRTAIGVININNIGMLAVMANPDGSHDRTIYSTETWSGGARTSFFARVDRSAGSEAVTVTSSNITVKTWTLPANGAAPSYKAATTWYASPYYGNVVTLAADVDHDGMDDIVAWNTDNVGVAFSTGSGFTSGGILAWGAFYGDVANLVGDANNDGYPDLIAWNQANVGIRYYQPASRTFGPVTVLPQSSYRGQNANFGGDLNGDGRIDLITLDPKNGPQGTYGIRVRLGTSAGFGPAKGWNAFPHGSKSIYAFSNLNQTNDDMFDIGVDYQDVYPVSGSSFGLPANISNIPWYGTQFTGGAWEPVFVADVC